MSLTTAIHIQCDQCGRWLRHASSGTYANQISAISYARLHGWTHGTRDLCPVCLRSKQSRPTLALAQGVACR